MVIGEAPKAIAENNAKFSVTPCTVVPYCLLAPLVFLGYSFIHGEKKFKLKRVILFHVGTCNM